MLIDSCAGTMPKIDVKPKGPPRLLAFSWAAVIFITSCFVVKPRAFVHAVSAAVPGRHLTENSFQSFWNGWWWLFVKGYHVLEFAILTALLLNWLRSRPVWLAALMAAAYASLDEIHQIWVPERGGRLTDVLIDMIGIVSVSLAACWVRRKSTVTQTTDHA